ncbi:Hypothetical predicted protein [Olea europaea subsp. europaea]|uniref:Uncharacterized protein n=1 Tax=Olea europaea subsp. europaea TaxID=158383 RepID=A0A8S0QTJ9_OLEEU|nr:Hypothetical predicted protein [Olea europaea subsp. europaea]
MIVLLQTLVHPASENEAIICPAHKWISPRSTQLLFLNPKNLGHNTTVYVIEISLFIYQEVFRFFYLVGETMHGAIHTMLKFQGCSLDDEDDWHHFKNAIRATIGDTPSSVVFKGRSPSPSPRFAQQPGNFSFSGTIARKDIEKRTVSPLRFPLLRSRSISSKPNTPKSSQPTTPNRSRSTTPNPSFGRQQYISEPRKSASLRFHVEKENPKDIEQFPSKSKRILNALLSRRELKKDETLYTYLDEY